MIAGALALLAFPALARLAADRLPIAPRAASLAPLDTRGPGGMPRDLPAGRIGPVPARPDDLEADAKALLGERAGGRIVALVDDDESRNWVVEKAVGGSLGSAPYPYRYPALERLLPDRLDARAATDLAARLMYLAAEPGRYGLERYPNAAPVAFALLDRVRAHGGCAAALDLLVLVAADDSPRDDVLPREAARVARACPGDVTPGWVLGQFQSQRALLSSTPLISHEGPTDERAAVSRPFATFRAQQRTFTRSAAPWSGEADANLRLAYQLPADQPFRARRLYTGALALYRRAARLAPGPESDAGLARALAGLGRPAEAVAARGARSPPARGRRRWSRRSSSTSSRRIASTRRHGPRSSCPGSRSSPPRRRRCTRSSGRRRTTTRSTSATPPDRCRSASAGWRR